MNNINNFEALIKEIAKGNENACRIIAEHITILCEQWGRKNKLELCWCAENNMVISAEKLFTRIGDIVIEAIKKCPERFISFTTYKTEVIEALKQFVGEGFENFNNMLIGGDNLSWNLLENKLKILSAKWFYNRKNWFKDFNSDIYSSSTAVLYEKISAEKKRFNDSNGLKSYFFSILENKALENNRKQLTYKTLHQTLSDEDYQMSISEEQDDTMVQIQNKINCLSETEQFIIVEYFWNEKKLNEIAGDLGISFENCRVIKHRAIKKISGFLKVRH